MNFPLHYGDDGPPGLVVRSGNGQFYELYEIATQAIVAQENHAAALIDHMANSAVVADVSTGRLYEVVGHRPPAAGWAVALPDPTRFRHQQYLPVATVPASVFQAPIPNTQADQPTTTYRPRGFKWEPVPEHLSVEQTAHVDVMVLKGRRFARLTPEAMAHDRDAEEAARRVLREREDAALEARRQMREAEARLAEDSRVQEEQRKGAEWLASLPPLMQPGALVLHMRHGNPRVGLVQYDGVRALGGGEFQTDLSPSKLPKCGRIVYRLEQREFPDFDKRCVWDELSVEDSQRFFIGDRNFPYQEYMAYEGPPIPIGSRLPREKALNGRSDPCPPEWHGLGVFILDVVGNEQSERAGDLFSVESALDYLRERSPIRPRKVRRRSNPEDDSDDGDDGSRSATFIDTINETVDERYSSLVNSGTFLDGHYDNFDGWHKQDKKLLDREAARRLENNKKWRARRPMIERILIALGARVVPYPVGATGEQIEAACNYGRDGIRVELAINDFDLDRLLAVLREQNCQVTYYQMDYEPAEDFVSRHTVTSDKLGDVFSCLRDSKGDPLLFGALTGHLIDDASEVEFVGEALLPAGEVGLIVAPQKLGKSVLSFNLAACVATGKPFLGLATKLGKAVLVHGEDTETTIKRRKKDAAEFLRGYERNLITLYARKSNTTLDRLFETLEKIDDLRLVVIDTVSSFVENVIDAREVRAFYERWQDFADRRRACVVFVHHSGKDLPAEKARSAGIVFYKMKGSGEFGSAARFIITLHLESRSRDGEEALKKGDRAITFHRGNLAASVPVLQGSHAFRMDRKTGLITEVKPPIVSIGEDGDGEDEDQPPASSSSVKRKGAIPGDEGTDADAHQAAPVIQRLEKDRGRRLPLDGDKSLFKTKAPGELKGWPRARCRAAHVRAIELGLCRPV